jgi:uncharacterized integral membrane protein (TIGR00698 family)
MDRLSRTLPGVLLAGLVGSAAYVAGQQAKIHTDLVSDVVVAILFGVLLLNAPTGRLLGLTNDSDAPTRWSEGLHFTDKKLLRLAIVLMGLKVQADLFEPQQAFMVLGILVLALPTAFLLIKSASRRLGLSEGMGDLLGIGTMICGATAINALAPVIKADRRDQGIAISAVFLFSIFALLAFSPVAGALGLSEQYSGLWAGLAVNDLSSSVAIGSQFGNEGEVLAAAAKSIRILMLGPLLIGFSMMRRSDSRKESWTQHLPLFILGYLGFFGLRILGDAQFGEDPRWADLLFWNGKAVKFLILAVCAGIGMQIRIQTLISVGWRAALAGGAGSLGLAGLSLAMLYAFENHSTVMAFGLGVGCLLVTAFLTRSRSVT